MTPFLDQAPCAMGSGYTVAFRFAGGRLDAIWKPAPPILQGQILRRYRRERDVFLRNLASEIGGRIVHGAPFTLAHVCWGGSRGYLLVIAGEIDDCLAV